MVLGAGTAEGSGSLTWGITCGVSAAVYTVFGRMAAPRYGSLAVTLYSTLGGGLLLLVAWGVGIIEVSMPPPDTWVLLVVFSLLTMSLATWLYFAALKRVEASRASIIATTEPVVASILAAVLLGQTMAPIGWAGLLLVVVGVAGAYGLRSTSTEAR
jgi:drug/metabolite transporter, DME family